MVGLLCTPGLALARLDELLRARPQVTLRILGALWLFYVFFLIFLVGTSWIRGALLNAPDLAIFTQNLWHTLHGRPFHGTIEAFMAGMDGASHFAFHNSPTLAVHLPLYLVWRSPASLMCTQVLLIPLGGLFIYRLARRRLDSPLSALLIMVAWWFHPAVLNNTLNVHPVAFALVTIPAAIERFDAGRPVAAWIFTALAVLSKESLALTGVALAAVAAIRYGRRWDALAAGLLSLGWFVLSVRLIIPWFRGGAPYQYSGRYAHLGEGFGEIALTVFTHPVAVLAEAFTPEKIIFIATFVVPFLLLPLAAPTLFLASIPAFAQSLLSGKQFDLWPFGRTACAVVAICAVAAVLGLANLSRLRGGPGMSRWITVAILVFMIGIFGRPELESHLRGTRALPAGVLAELQDVDPLIDEDEPLSVHSALIHLYCQRAVVNAWPVGSHERDKVLILKIAPVFWPLPEQKLAAEASLRASPQHRILWEGKWLVLFGRL